MTAPLQQLGSFQLGDRIGSGAMGVVYRATHTKTGIPAAVKVITAPEASQAGRSGAADRFEREAEILQQFRHPGIVRFLAVGRSKGTRYIAMEFVEGQTLEQLLLEHQAIEWPKVVDVGTQVCDALEYAHDRGVVHRDLKPSNLMITADGVVKLTDFGVAKDLDATALTSPGKTVGTAAYMAPEQIRGSTQISHKIDLYALGCVLYQMLTGDLPFKGTNAAALMNGHLNVPAPRASEKAPQIPRALDDLILRMMAKEPQQRPWDAAAVAQELRALQGMLTRGEPIKLVFGPPYLSDPSGRSESAQVELQQNPAAQATKASTLAGTNPRTNTDRKKKKKGTTQGWQLPSLTTLLLAASAIGLVGLIIYLLQPPSADQLFEQARPLMESDDLVQWQDADRRYLGEFERRFPTDPRVSRIQELRDRILLSKTRARARLLTSISKPQNDAETAYLEALKRAEDADHQGFENLAAETWNRLQMNYIEAEKHATAEDQAVIKGWKLLAGETANTFDTKVKERTIAARNRLIEATTAESNGQEEFGAERRRSLIRDFGNYPYLREILDAAKSGLPDSGPVDSPPADRPASP